MIGRIVFPAILAIGVAGCAPGVAPDLRQSLTRATIDQSPAPLILAELSALGGQATLVPAGRNGPVQTWRTGQNQMLSFSGGVLVATRGLGNDLMSADVSATLAALNGGPRMDYPRLLTFLDGEGRTVYRAMLCDMGPGVRATVDSFAVDFPTTLHVETCRTTGLTVENRYWRNPDGSMRKTDQWIGPAAGQLAAEWLSR